jgi:hypothetical protein
LQGVFGDQVGYAVALFGAQFLLSTAKPGSAVRTFCVTADSSLLVSEVVQFSMSVDRKQSKDFNRRIKASLPLWQQHDGLWH